MKKKTGIRVTVAVVLLLVLVGGIYFTLAKKYMPNSERVPAEEVYPVAAGEAHLIFWQNQYEKNALLGDGTAYLDQDTVCDLIEKGFYYDENELVVSYVTPTQIVRIPVGDDGYYVNQDYVRLSAPAVLKKGELLYYSMELLSIFSDVTYQIYQNPSRVVVRSGAKELLCLKTVKNTALRELPDRKARVLDELSAETKVLYAEGEGNGENGYIRVMTEDGIYGYIRKKDLTETYYETITSSFPVPEFTHLLQKEPVVLGWHQVTSAAANATLDGLIQGNDKLTVISPTWFRLSSEEGELTSIADKEYVRKAKAKGLAVWGLFDNFDAEVSTYAVLSSTRARENLTEEMLRLAKEYGLDGINIDFENLSLATGPHFIQFLRELSVKCRAAGLVLSVDDPVPVDYAAYYDWRSQGNVVDYVIIMAYDEHYAGSPVAGPVASYGYLTDAVDGILTMVPKEQVIMAVPFYTRLWTETETAEGRKLTSVAFGMQVAQSELARNGVTAKWDAKTRQYYAEYNSASGKNKIWLEEKDSLREKLLYIKDAGLAGTAVWRLGLEQEEVWELFDFETLSAQTGEDGQE